MEKKQEHSLFGLCVENKDCEDLERRKIYRTIPDEEASKKGYIRVHCWPIYVEIVLSCLDFIEISEADSVFSKSGLPTFDCARGSSDRRESGSEKATISHRARRERGEEGIDLQEKQMEGLYSVVSAGSSGAGVRKELSHTKAQSSVVKTLFWTGMIQFYNFFG